MDLLRHYLSCILPLSLVLSLSAQTPNSVTTTIYQDEEGTKTLSSKQYSDGLGRQLQSHVQNAARNSIVTSTEFDAAGRPYKSYKPYVKSGSGMLFEPQAGEQAVNYWQTRFPGQSAFYTETRYSDDPLSRVIESGNIGDAFSLSADNHPRIWYFSTAPAGQRVPDNIDITDQGAISYALFQGSGTPLTIQQTVAALNNLPTILVTNPTHFLTITMDANGSISQEVRDIFGRTTHTTSSTTGTLSGTLTANYEYDILGNMLTETPPQEDPDPLLAHRYRYNTLGQLASENLPDIFGNAPSRDKSYTYDDAGRVTRVTVPTEKDGFQNVNTEYDDLGRVLRIHSGSTQTQPTIEYYYDGLGSLSPEQYTTFLGRLNGCDISASELSAILVELHSDRHCRGKSMAAVAINPDNQATGQTELRNYVVIDLMTYDAEGRVAQSWRLTSLLPVERSVFEYDFMDRLIHEARTVGKNTTLHTSITYDEAGRVAGVYRGAPTLGNCIVAYTYDDLGRMIRKDLHQQDGQENSYVINFSYTIREWLSTIEAGGGLGSKAPNSFHEHLFYNNGHNPQFTGNISQVEAHWGNFRPIRSVYEYDFISRLQNTSVSEIAGPQDNTLPIGISSLNEDFGYDNAGRFTTKWEGKDGIDQSGNRSKWKYGYYASTSRLKNRTQATPETMSARYIYDTRGNLICDVDKKMVVEYDWRNLARNYVFYSAIPADVLDNVQNGVFNSVLNPSEPQSSLDLAATMRSKLSTASPQITRLSEVLMVYDAGGNRVLKVEK